jgi:hypothetical protein
MAEEKTLQMLPRLAQHPHRCRTRPDQVAHGLMGVIGNPHRGQELCGILGDGVNQAADLISDATSIPSLNFTPLMTFGN